MQRFPFTRHKFISRFISATSTNKEHNFLCPKADELKIEVFKKIEMWRATKRERRRRKRLNCLYIRLSKRMNVKASINISIFKIEKSFNSFNLVRKSDNWFIDRDHSVYLACFCSISMPSKWSDIQFIGNCFKSIPLWRLSSLKFVFSIF